ncbi:MAG: hypothetical protein K9K75_05655 [Deltaproteobacteria bacterium]|nr:hypothetical protein [Deltaproteobacteria bacterium]
MGTKEKCPICNTDRFSIGGNILVNITYKCDFCGDFCWSVLDWKDERTRLTFAYYYHRFLKREVQEEPIKINNDVIKRALEVGLPTPGEQINNLLLYIGERTKKGFFGESIMLDKRQTSITIGTKENALDFLVGELESIGYIKQSSAGGEVIMTVEGYERYETLLQGVSDAKKAFMAMKYGDAELDEVFENVFKPAVKKAGFELYRLDEKPEAGIIDNRLRVEIRNARFLIADLTHNNEGAYWEAGFAEGLGKKVIPTCRKGSTPHFNLGHIQTVFWQKDNPECEQQLKAIIRNTFPDEAKMED